MDDKQHVVFESRVGKARRASSARVIDMVALISDPPNDLEAVVNDLSAADQQKLLVALALEVSFLRQVIGG